MKLNNISQRIFGLAIFAALLFAFSTDAFAQGRGRGGGGGNGGGRGNSPIFGGGSSRGNDDMRRGRSDDRRGPEARGRAEDERSRGKGRNHRDGEARGNGRGGSQRYEALGRKFGMSGEEFRSYYEAERRRNPDLTFGQFIAANMIARNQGSRYPGVTSERILSGLRSGKSLGETLKDLRVRNEDIRRERQRIKNEIEDYDDDYRDDDFDLDW